VSDDPEIRRELTYGFPDDVEVVLAEDARDAWEKLKTMTPAVVVGSIRTGRSGSWALGHDMGTEPRLARVPILMVLEREQDVWLAKEGRATAVRVQPLGGSDIVDDVLELMSAGSAE
jgi:DNA-binding response OmpR family regulator